MTGARVSRLTVFALAVVSTAWGDNFSFTQLDVPGLPGQFDTWAPSVREIS